MIKNSELKPGDAVSFTLAAPRAVDTWYTHYGNIDKLDGEWATVMSTAGCRRIHVIVLRREHIERRDWPKPHKTH